MKKKYIIILLATILVLSGCNSEYLISDPSNISTPHQTDPELPKEQGRILEDGSEFLIQESVYQTYPEVDDSSENMPSSATESSDETTPATTEPPKSTAPAIEDIPRETAPSETKPVQTAPTEYEHEDATQPTSVPETTDPAVTEITYEFKRQVASYAVAYINSYRGSPCTVLSGMSKVAQFRADQLTWNYGHSVSDKRAALANFEYGRFVDATEFGDDASNSYWEADSAEAICAGFYGTDPEAMGKRIAELLYNSSGHWSYISSSEYSYIGVGIAYREGSEYGWYCCVMVGSVNYG